MHDMEDMTLNLPLDNNWSCSLHHGAHCQVGKHRKQGRKDRNSGAFRRYGTYHPRVGITQLLLIEGIAQVPN